jgi:hypothetical protein
VRQGTLAFQVITYYRQIRPPKEAGGSHTPTLAPRCAQLDTSSESTSSTWISAPGPPRDGRATPRGIPYAVWTRIVPRLPVRDVTSPYLFPRNAFATHGGMAFKRSEGHTELNIFCYKLDTEGSESHESIILPCDFSAVLCKTREKNFICCTPRCRDFSARCKSTTLWKPQVPATKKSVDLHRPNPPRIESPLYTTPRRRRSSVRQYSIRLLGLHFCTLDCALQLSSKSYTPFTFFVTIQ